MRWDDIRGASTRSPIKTSGMTEFDFNFVRVARDGAPRFCQSRFGIIFSSKMITKSRILDTANCFCCKNSADVGTGLKL